MPAWDARAEPREAPVLAEELDHLLELRLRLVDPGDVRPGDRVDRLLLDRRRLHARHEADGHHQQDHDDPEEHHRHPDDDGVLELLPAVGDDRAQEVLPAHLRTIGGLRAPVNGRARRVATIARRPGAVQSSTAATSGWESHLSRRGSGSAGSQVKSSITIVPPGATRPRIASGSSFASTAVDEEEVERRLRRHHVRPARR